MFRNLFHPKEMEKYIFIGLGNPGKDYAETRHNVGFMAIDRLADHWNVSASRLKHKSLVGEYRSSAFRAVLVKPQTYMNRSGFAARQFIHFYKTPLSQVMVIFDDLDLPFGTVRIRQSGGSSGQKGVKSIIEQLGTEDFPRMRIGIGRPPGKVDSVDFILDEFKPVERDDLEIILKNCVDAIEVFIHDGIEKAMTLYNNDFLYGQN